MQEASVFGFRDQSVRLVGDQDARQSLLCSRLAHLLEPIVQAGKLLGYSERGVVKGDDQDDALHVPVVELD